MTHPDEGSGQGVSRRAAAVTDRMVRRLLDALEEHPLLYFFDVVVYQDLQNRDPIDHIDRVGCLLYGRESE